jgi:hypothetical protein
MVRAVASGIIITQGMVSKILAMVERGDRRHDIAAWFGVNQGRIKEVEDGDHGLPALANPDELPPAGSPGPKALELRAAIQTVQDILLIKGASGVADALHQVKNAITEFDKNE